jgi:tetratricopeptide (TPR) repeat protein
MVFGVDAMADLPLPKVPAAALQRLDEYLKRTGESKEDIAFTGPSQPLPEQECVYFRLICAAALVKDDPTNSFNYLSLANAFLAAGDAESAICVYRYMEGVGYRFMAYYDDPLFNIGITEADRGNYDAALSAFAACALRYPRSASEVAFYEGTVNHERGDFPRAEACYVNALSVLWGSRTEERARAVVERLAEDARKHQPFTGKRKSPWMEFIH